MKTNKFLNEKVKERGLTSKEFAKMVGISERYARMLLSPDSRKLPSDDLGKRIVKALNFSREEEKEFWKLLEEDRKELEEEPELPPPNIPDIEEIKKLLRELQQKLENTEKWIQEVEEMVLKFRKDFWVFKWILAGIGITGFVILVIILSMLP